MCVRLERSPKMCGLINEQIPDWKAVVGSLYQLIPLKTLNHTQTVGRRRYCGTTHKPEGLQCDPHPWIPRLCSAVWAMANCSQNQNVKIEALKLWVLVSLSYSEAKKEATCMFLSVSGVIHAAVWLEAQIGSKTEAPWHQRLQLTLRPFSFIALHQHYALFISCLALTKYWYINMLFF